MKGSRLIGLCLALLVGLSFFGAAVADCADARYMCFKGDIRIEPDAKDGTCWEWFPPRCGSCRDRSLSDQAVVKCNQRHRDDCDGNCTAESPVENVPL